MNGGERIPVVSLRCVIIPPDDSVSFLNLRTALLPSFLISSSHQSMCLIL